MINGKGSSDATSKRMTDLYKHQHKHTHTHTYTQKHIRFGNLSGIFKNQEHHPEFKNNTSCKVACWIYKD